MIKLLDISCLVFPGSPERLNSCTTNSAIWSLSFFMFNCINFLLIFFLAKVAKNAGKYKHLSTKLGHPEVLLLPDQCRCNLKQSLSSLCKEK